MATEVGIKELRDRLSRYVEEVRATRRELLVTDRGTPVAKLVPLDPWDERLAHLVAEGAVTQAAVSIHPFPMPTVTMTAGPTAAEMVVGQRRRE